MIITFMREINKLSWRFPSLRLLIVIPLEIFIHDVSNFSSPHRNGKNFFPLQFNFEHSKKGKKQESAFKLTAESLAHISIQIT